MTAILNKNINAACQVVLITDAISTGSPSYPEVTPFDLKTEQAESGQTVLHKSCMIPSLNVINDLCGALWLPADPLCLDNNARLPSHYINQCYLTSKKVMLKYERRKFKQEYQSKPFFSFFLAIFSIFAHFRF